MELTDLNEQGPDPEQAARVRQDLLGLLRLLAKHVACGLKQTQQKAGAGSGREKSPPAAEDSSEQRDGPKTRKEP